jgi:hypothetical protein
MMFGEALGRAMGAGFIYSMCTLKVPHMQLEFVRAGYKLLGFAPENYLVIPNQSNLTLKTLVFSIHVP